MAENYQEAYSWKEAIALSLQIYSLSDELPASEDGSLKVELRRAAVEIPATIAADLVAEQPARREPLLRLQAQLELIRRIYPALDTNHVDAQSAELYRRLSLPGTFTEMPAPPEPEPEPDAQPAAGEHDTAAANDDD